MKRIILVATLLIGLVSCNKPISPNELHGSWVHEKTERYDMNGVLVETIVDGGVALELRSFFFHDDGSGFAGIMNFTYKVSGDIITLSGYSSGVDGLEIKKQNNHLIFETKAYDGEWVVNGRKVHYYIKEQQPINKSTLAIVGSVLFYPSSCKTSPQLPLTSSPGLYLRFAA